MKRGYWNSEFIRLFEKNNPSNLLHAFEIITDVSGKKAIVKCLNCGEVHEIDKSYFVKRNGSCNSNKCRIEKIRKTTLDRYGKEYYCQTDTFKKDMIEYHQTNFGVNWSSQVPETRKKQAETNILRYGHPSPLENSEVIAKSKETKILKYKDENYNNRTKAKQTNIEKYGVEVPSQSAEIRQKAVETSIKNFGTSSPMKNKTVVEKSQSIRRDNLLSGKTDTTSWLGYSRGIRVKLLSFPHLFHSRWEAIFQLEHPDYEYEKLRLPYTNDSNKSCVYIVDFICHSRKEIVEIKPIWQMNTPNVIIKCNTAKEWANSNGYTFTVINDSYFKDKVLDLGVVEYTITPSDSKKKQRNYK